MFSHRSYVFVNNKVLNKLQDYNYFSLKCNQSLVQRKSLLLLQVCLNALEEEISGNDFFLHTCPAFMHNAVL